MADPRIQINLMINGSPLQHLLARIGEHYLLKQLIKHPQLDVNTLDKQGKSAVHSACEKNNSESLKILLSHRHININQHGEGVGSPFYYAALNNFKECGEILLKRTELNINEKFYGKTLFSGCVQKDHWDMAELILKDSRSDYSLIEQSDFFNACANGADRLVALMMPLLKQIPNVCINGTEYLAQKERVCESLLYAAAMGGYWKIVKELIAHPAIELNVTQEDDCSPLWIASNRGHTEVVELLLNERGIQVNAQFPKEKSPLRAACFSGNKKIMELLLNHPDIELDKGELLTLITTSYRSDSSLMQMVLNHPKMDVNVRGADGKTALYTAVQLRNEEKVNLLLNSPQIKVNLSPPGGSLFKAACEFKEEKIIERLIRDFRVDLDPRVVDKNKGELRGVVNVMNIQVDHLKMIQQGRWFAGIVLFCDNYFSLKEEKIQTEKTTRSELIRFLTIAEKLPMELQMLLSNRIEGSIKENIPSFSVERGLRYMLFLVEK